MTPMNAAGKRLKAVPAGLNHATVAGSRAACCVAALLACLVYWPSLTHEFVGDDEPIISNDARLMDPGFIRDIWRAPWWPEGSEAPASRPLTTLTYWVETQAAGLRPWHFHAINILLFAALSAAVAWLATAWIGAPVAGWIAGSLFAVHPVHVEAVVGVVGRGEILAALFIVLGLIFYSRWRPTGFGWRRSLCLAAFVLLAGLSKEHGYLLAAMYGAAELAERRRGSSPMNAPRWPWRLGVLIFVVAGIAFAQRQAMVRHAGHEVGQVADLDNPLITSDMAERVVSPFLLVGKAAELLTWPEDQSPDYSPRVLMPTDSLIDPLVLTGLAVVAGWIAAVIAAWKRASVLVTPLLMLPIAWFIPSNTLLLIGTIFGERLVFAVSVFIPIVVAGLLVQARLSSRVQLWIASASMVAAAVLTASLWRRWSPFYEVGMLEDHLGLVLGVFLAAAAAAIALFVHQNRFRWTACAVAAVLSSYGVATILYAGTWKSGDSLVFATAQLHPTDSRFLASVADRMIGLAINNPQQKNEFLTQAENSARAALEAWPRQMDPYRVLAAAAELRGDRETALRYYKYVRTMKLVAYRGFSDRIMAVVTNEATPDEVRQKIVTLREQLRQKPGDPVVLRQLAGAYAAAKEYDKSVAILERLVTPQTTDGGLLQEFINVLIDGGHIEKTLPIYRQWLKAEPDNWAVLTDAAMLSVSLKNGDPNETRSWIDRAMKLSPGSAEPWAALAQWHIARNEADRAIEAYRQALLRADAKDPKRPHYLLQIEQLSTKAR
jgi:tetratricopeptide (TPR) repeat protein